MQGAASGRRNNDIFVGKSDLDPDFWRTRVSSFKGWPGSCYIAGLVVDPFSFPAWLLQTEWPLRARHIDWYLLRFGPALYDALTGDARTDIP